MSFFPFFPHNKVGLAWEYETKGLLWRVVVSDTFLLIGENRDPAEKKVSYFCLHADTGVPLWKNRTFQEQWWIGIEAVHRQILLLHEYASPDMPEHKKIIAVDLASGETRWRNDELMYAGAAGEFVYGRKNLFADGCVYELDCATGTVMNELDDESFANIHTISLGARPDLIFPVGFSPGTSVPAPLQNHLRRRGSAASADVSGVEHLAFENMAIFTWYERGTTSGLRQFLAVLDRDGNRSHYSDVITNDAAFPVPDSFFVAGRNIIYTKGRNVLRSVAIAGEEGGDGKS